jgi:hypothetical protein
VTDAALLSLLVRTATIVHRTQDGPPATANVPTWQEAPGLDVACYLEQTEAREITIGRETQIATHLLVVAPDVPLSGSDKVTVEGMTYEVLGPPAKVADPVLNVIDHLEANLRELSE